LNRIGPDYEGKELGIGESILIKAVAAVTGRSTANIKKDMEKQGDLGLVAQSSKTSQKTMFTPAALTLAFVFKSLKEISEISGTSSQQKKLDKINRLLVACTGSETKYIVR
jgi:DNA ligase-1